MAELHPQLEKDCLIIGRFPLCRLLLMLDVNYPWFLLVPDREGITEIHQLSEQDQQQLMRESSYLAKVLEQEFQADKINVAALGNLVPQLHVHHVVRYRNDAAWPHPIWGRVEPKPYCEEAVSHIIRRLQRWPLEDFTFGEQSSAG
jgi:diadenosine tetraphosphate (Ap4A) HIT family hydrolase